MKLNYGPGTWFTVPLGDGTYAVGVIARMRPRGKIVFGYFFGPSYSVVPELSDLRDLRPEQAVYVGKFGDLGLYRGEWTVIGDDVMFTNEGWPLPVFRQDQDHGLPPLIVRYDENMADVEVTKSTPEFVSDLPDSGLGGSRYIEIVLSRMLGAQPESSK